MVLNDRFVSSSGPARRRLQARSSSSMGLERAQAVQYAWGGYELVADGTSRPIGANLMQEIRQRARWLGGLGKGNVLLGGLSLTQHRQAWPCDTVLASGNADSSQEDGCIQSASLDSSTTLPERRRAAAATAPLVYKDDDHVQPWGRDPVFTPGSSLFDSSLVGQETVYYDPNSELNPLGAPYMWLSDGVAPGGDYSLVVDNNVGADRANALWRAVDEGRFFDRATTGLTASVLVFNVEYQVFGYGETRYFWNADGLIHVESVTPVGVPSLVPVLALSLKALAVLCFVVYSVRLGTSRELVSRAREVYKKLGDMVFNRILGKRTAAHQKKKADESTMTGRGRASGVIKAYEVWDILLAVLLVAALAANLASVLASQHIRAEASYKLYDAPLSSRARYC